MPPIALSVVLPFFLGPRRVSFSFIITTGGAGCSAIMPP